VTIIGDNIYMLYTAYGDISQIAMASISVKELVNQKWDGWKRYGLVFPGMDNKDAILIDSKEGLYLIHRMGGKNMYSIRFDNIETLLAWNNKKTKKK